MDMKPILLPEAERQVRKAHELEGRGYAPTEIAEAMGLRDDHVTKLLQPKGATADE